MKKLYIILLFFTILSIPMFSSAQGIMDFTNSDTPYISIERDHTAREEAEGKLIFEKLQKNELTCENLTNDDFSSLGEYFMGQMTGESHAAMNNMMIAMLGEEGEKQMHMVMGKRLSECDLNAEVPQSFLNNGMMQMMLNGGMMGNGNPYTYNTSTNFPTMMNYGYGIFGFAFMILFWVILIIGTVALIKWILSQNKIEKETKKSALDILKERYAKGEMDKKEFDEKKKDLQ